MHRRRSPRLDGYDYAGGGWYFVTTCAASRGTVFGTVAGGAVQLSRLGSCAERALRATPDHLPVALDTWIVMPDHVHAVFVLPGGEVGLSVVVGTYKAAVTRATGRAGLWQRGFYDHVIRDDADLERVREYICTNPIRWELRHGVL